MNYEPASWTTQVGTCQPGARALLAHAHELGLGDVGCFNDRAVRGTTATPSLHREGRAVDVTVGHLDEGWLTAYVEALVGHYAELGIQQVIWLSRSWRCDRLDYPDVGRWRPYDGADPHTSHAHVELTTTAAQSLTIEAIRTILQEDDEMPSAAEIVEAFMARKIKTRYDVAKDGSGYEVEITLEQLISNAYIEQQKKP